MGGNSLLELIVFGKQAGLNAAKYVKVNTEHTTSVALLSEAKATHPIDNPEIDFYKVREELGNIFYKNVGIVRDKESLNATLNAVEEYIKQLPKMGVSDSSKLYNTNLVEFLEFKNMLELSRLVLSSALSREESRGAHFRVDFPDESESFASHTIIDRDGALL